MRVMCKPRQNLCTLVGEDEQWQARAEQSYVISRIMTVSLLRLSHEPPTQGLSPIQGDSLVVLRQRFILLVALHNM